eukprot:COSAG05_NODE_583_length_8532_cov_66.822365_2_plen_106_part_00
MDQICWLVEQACATDVPPRESDVLKKQAIAGLRRTVLRDGRTLWLSEQGRALCAEQGQLAASSVDLPAPRGIVSTTGSATRDSSSYRTSQDPPPAMAAGRHYTRP